MSGRLRPPLARTLAVLGLALASANCRTSGLAFERSDRLEVVAPRDSGVVTLPLQIRWRAVAGFERGKPETGRGYYYAVFLDRSPVAPGESILRAVGDETCRRQGFACATPEFFAQNFVYVTERTSVTVPGVPVGLNTHHKENVNHQLSVVLMGPGDRRVGETVGLVHFHVKGRNTTGGNP